MQCDSSRSAARKLKGENPEELTEGLESPFYLTASAGYTRTDTRRTGSSNDKRRGREDDARVLKFYRGLRVDVKRETVSGPSLSAHPESGTPKCLNLAFAPASR